MGLMKLVQILDVGNVKRLVEARIWKLIRCELVLDRLLDVLVLLHEFRLLWVKFNWRTPEWHGLPLLLCSAFNVDHLLCVGQKNPGRCLSGCWIRLHYAVTVRLEQGRVSMVVRWLWKSVGIGKGLWFIVVVPCRDLRTGVRLGLRQQQVVWFHLVTNFLLEDEFARSLLTHDWVWLLLVIEVWNVAVWLVVFLDSTWSCLAFLGLPGVPLKLDLFGVFLLLGWRNFYRLYDDLILNNCWRLRVLFELSCWFLLAHFAKIFEVSHRVFACLRDCYKFPFRNWLYLPKAALSRWQHLARNMLLHANLSRFRDLGTDILRHRFILRQVLQIVQVHQPWSPDS